MVITDSGPGGLVRVRDIIEKPDPGSISSTLATIGRYVFPPSIFTCLDEVKPGRGGEIQLTDAIQLLCKRDDVYAFVFRGRRYDIGDKTGWLRAGVELALERPEFRRELRSYLSRLSRHTPRTK